MAYVDIATLQTIAAGQPLSAATVQQIRDNGEFLIDPPACSVYNSSAQSISNSTQTVLTANSEWFDNNSMHSTSSNTSRITTQTAGRYWFFAAVEFAANATGVRSIEFFANGGAGGSYVIQGTNNIGGIFDLAISGSRSFVMPAAGYIEVRAFQTSGAALNVTLREFSAVYLTR